MTDMPVGPSDIKKVQQACPGLSPEVIQNCGKIVSTGPVGPTAFEQRISQAAKIMGITVIELWVFLNALGIENSAEGQMLLEAETTQEGDARAVMVEGKGLPKVMEKVPNLVKIARFKAGWASLKEGKGETSPKSCGSDMASLIDTIKRIEQRSNEELLEMYKPEATEVFPELRKRTNDRPCIIFTETGAVDQKNSLKLLRTAHRQETPTTFMVEGNLVRVYRVDEFPMEYFEECPLHSEIILAEGHCEKCENSWDGITSEDRVIVRVARDMDMIDLSPVKVYELIDRIKKEGAKFLLKVGKTGIQYRELKELGRLPVLRRKASKTDKSDPFFVHKTY